MRLAILGLADMGELSQKASWLGTGSFVRNNISIGSDVVVGVGSAVVHDVADGLMVAGVPARPLERS